MVRRYSTNPLAVLFHPSLDEQNGCETLVFNPQTRNILKVNHFGYNILNAVDKNPGITLNGACELVSQKYGLIYWQNESKILKFIERMVEENIIFEK